MKTYLYNVLILTLIIILNSCNKFVEVDLPPNQITSKNAFADINSTTAVLMGIYSNVSNTPHTLNAEMHIATSLNSGELLYTGSAQKYWDFENSSIQPDNGLVKNMWTATYNTIYNVNILLEGLNSSSSLKDQGKARIIGEAKFLRAFSYFYLVNLYGSVPLILTSDHNRNKSIGRVGISDIYAQIEDDLMDAQKLLEENYPSPGRVRANFHSATSLLARMYLYQKKWEEAVVEASKVINSGIYSLSPASEVFMNNSNETIWQIMPVYPNQNTGIGRLLIPNSPSSIPDYHISSDLMSSFVENDSRKSDWIGASYVANETYYFANKYKVKLGGELEEYLIALRLAELYFIRAEANAQLGNFSEAILDLNKIRERAGLGDYQYESTESLFKVISEERKLEFFTEWGHRWFDLKRSGESEKILKPLKGENWQSFDINWPIPFSELMTNPSLTQNEGY